MKQTISFVTLGVADLERSRRFYRALGWTESPSSQTAVAFFQVGCIAFALFGRESLADDANVSSEGSGFPGFTIAHNVASESDVEATLREALAAGGRLIRAAEKRPGVVSEVTLPIPMVFSGKSVTTRSFPWMTRAS